MVKFLFSRYITYAVFFLEVLLVPIFLNKSDYVQYEYLKNVINISSFVLLGSHTGFIYYYYSKKEDFFPELLKLSVCVLLFSSLIFSIFYKNLFLILPLFCYGISVFTEKKLQIEKKFYLAILYKPLLALALILAVFCSVYFLNYKANTFFVLAIGYSTALIIWFLMIKLFAKNIFIEFINLKFSITVNDVGRFIKMIKVGIIENAATFFLMVYLFVDRYMLKNFYKEELPSYSLAFNFSQFVFIGINSLAYIQNVEIGENLSSLNKEWIIKILKKAFLFFIILFLGVLCLSFVYGLIFPGFENLLGYTILLSFFIGIFYAFNVLSVIPLFKGKQSVITMSLALLLLINVAVSFLFYRFNISPMWNIGKTAILLTLFGVYLAIYSIKLVQRLDA